MAFMDTVRGGSIGWIVALLVLVVAIVLLVIGMVTPPQTILLLIAGLALSRLL